MLPLAERVGSFACDVVHRMTKGECFVALMLKICWICYNGLGQGFSRSV